VFQQAYLKDCESYAYHKLECNDPRSIGDAPASLDGVAPAAAAWGGEGRRVRGILFRGFFFDAVPSAVATVLPGSQADPVAKWVRGLSPVYFPYMASGPIVIHGLRPI
jgi:hypothetical protein